jgi:hypothetical protein
MFQVFKKQIDSNQNEFWELVEQMEDDLALAQRLIDLRMDGSEYRAEVREGSCSMILDV